MYQIQYVNTDPVIVFAATELKKYLRMMMPRCGEIPVSSSPSEGVAFRLGLLSDFDLPCQAENPRLDDVLYVNTQKDQGVIAGSNPRSVLLSVYRYLKEQGCLWLFPGPDGESIPVVDELKPVAFSHMATSRYRGQCNEGAETQQMMMEAIDFTPKIGLNSFMIEFDIPKFYYERSIQHKFDPLPAEAPLSNETILQWKRQCEAEIAKRGLLFHDMGHGWTAEPFGFDSTDGWVANEVELGDNARHLAMVNGVRQFHGGIALNTNVCMSNPETRSIIAKYIADYARKQNNVDFLHVWLADASNNHCECEECKKKDTSDWYVMLLNDIDEELTFANSQTHIVFIAYVDTLWAPYQEVLRNTQRFTMLFAPITRLYTETYQLPADSNAVKPYVRNQLVMPKGMAENLAYLQEWKKMWKGDCFCYEYHFWLCCHYDLGVMYLAKIIYDDVHGLKKNGLSGIVEDGSQAAFFPNGFQYYVYAESLLDADKSFETMIEEYFPHAYGEDWKLVLDYFNAIVSYSDFGFVKGEKSKDKSISNNYDPDKVRQFKKLEELVDAFLPVIEAHLNLPKRCQFVSWDLLKWHASYVKIVSKGVAAIAQDDRATSFACFKELANTMAPLRYYRSSVYDHEICCSAMRRVLDPDRKYAQVFNG